MSEYPMIKMAGRGFKERLKKLKPFISTEETRHYLNGVYVVYDNLTLTLVATNGHILQEQVFDVEVELSEQYKKFACILPRTAVDALIKIMPSKKESMFTMQIVDSDAGPNLRFDFFENEYITALIEGDYPDYKAIMPRGEVQLQSGLSAGYLIDALRALGNEPVNICIDKGEDGLKPHLLTSDGVAGVRCVVMPKVAFGAS